MLPQTYPFFQCPSLVHAHAHAHACSTSRRLAVGISAAGRSASSGTRTTRWRSHALAHVLVRCMHATLMHASKMHTGRMTNGHASPAHLYWASLHTTDRDHLSAHTACDAHTQVDSRWPNGVWHPPCSMCDRMSCARVGAGWRRISCLTRLCTQTAGPHFCGRRCQTVRPTMAHCSRRWT
eukprot:355679-Chlamydomonas_euryale.AAC.3